MMIHDYIYPAPDDGDDPDDDDHNDDFSGRHRATCQVQDQN